MCNKNLKIAFSSGDYWSWSFSSFERRPACPMMQAKETGTLLRFDMAPNVRGSPGQKLSARASLARSLMLNYRDDADGRQQ